MVIFRQRRPCNTRNQRPGYNTLLLRFIPDLLSVCPHIQFHTLPGLLDSRAVLSNSYPNACVPIIIIDNTVIECVDSFNFLGIYLDKYMNWKRHTDYIASKISKSIGILNSLKHILPTEIKLMIYNSLILSHINYGILIWGYHSDRLYKLQKKL